MDVVSVKRVLGGTRSRGTLMTQKNTDATRDLARGLAALLGDTFVLGNTTQAFHWNVEGPHFAQLHEMFERQYEDLAEAIDTIAERIRALGYYAPETLPRLIELSRLQQTENVRTEERMLARLIEGHRQVAHRIRELQNLTDRAVDEATADLLIERLRVHEKTAWMLESQAGHGSAALDELSGRREAS